MANEVQWIFVTAFLLSAAVSFSTSAKVDLLKIHEHMTEEELFTTFNVKNRETVPDYEVVPVSHKEHRSRRSVSPYDDEERWYVLVKDLELYLEPVEHVLFGENTPVYTASRNKSQPLGIRYKRVNKPWPSNYTLYQDTTNYAAVAMFKEPNGKINLDGTIGDDTVIKPVPSRFHNSVASFKNDEYRTHHFVYKKTPWSFDNIFGDDDWLKYFNYIPYNKPQHPRPVTKVDIVYPEILVIVDYETYLAHGKDVKALSRYMAVFWNAVDLRFRGMKEIKVRLNIAGLIIPIDKYGAPYMSYYQVDKSYLRCSETFDDVGKYLYQDKRFGKNMYDIAVAITSFNLCSTKRNGGCDPSTLGMARVGGACDHDDDSLDAAIAVVEDKGGFDGVLTTAHEIGHLLGAMHDGEGSNYGPGARKCDWSDGFLMASSQQGTGNAFLWSDCSIEQMEYFLRREAECLRNKPIVKKPYPKILPGQVMSRDEQCRMMHGMVECKGARGDECGELYCRKPGRMFNYNCISSRPPAEGSPCSDGGMCLDGKCVYRREEKINKVTEKKTTAASRRTQLIEGADDD